MSFEKFKESKELIITRYCAKCERNSKQLSSQLKRWCPTTVQNTSHRRAVRRKSQNVSILSFGKFRAEAN